jgi:hypothetical protein
MKSITFDKEKPFMANTSRAKSSATRNIKIRDSTTRPRVIIRSRTIDQMRVPISSSPT